MREAAARGEGTITVPHDLAEALEGTGEDGEVGTRSGGALGPLHSAAPYRVTEPDHRPTN